MHDHNVAGKPGLDPTLPDVSLILGGTTYKLCYDYNAIVLAEQATGVNLLKAILSEINATNLRGLLWAAMHRHSPSLSLDDVGALIRPTAIGEIHAALVATWFGSIAEPEEHPEGKAAQVA